MEGASIDSVNSSNLQAGESNNTELFVENSEERFSAIKDDKSSDSDSHSEDLNLNDDQNNVISNSNSQFYESSDSKIDYGMKIDDNDTLSDIEDIKTDSASADSEDSALGSLPPDTAFNDREEDTPDRSEGSDSNLGSETPDDIKLPTFNLALPCTNSLSLKPYKIPGTSDMPNDNSNVDVDNAIAQVKTPPRSNLKRKLSEENDNTLNTKKRKESIKFDNVTVYYFPRSQGFSCVPSQGGSTLGMEWEHSHIQSFTLLEHALEQRRIHRQILQKIKNERHSLQGAAISSSEDSDTEEEASDISESELDLDNYYFLQPIPTRQRRALLRAAGVRKIEAYEKDECRDIRTSREFCGCACKGACNPDSCSCHIAGIKCQVDRLNFPCGCTREACGNSTGRIEFNPVRVRTHFIHTLMRLGLEKKNEENQEAAKRQWAEVHNPSSVPCQANSSFERERCFSQENGLLRDVSLTPRVEVESCVNSGNYSNVHCDVNNPHLQGNMQDNLNYGFKSENSNTRNLIDNSMMLYENPSNSNLHADPYTSNILQGKGPPYNIPLAYDPMSSTQRFQCEVNYSYEQRPENHNFKGLQSFSATSFEDFAHSSQISMFNHYGHVYSSEYMHKQNTIHDHNSSQYSTLPQHNYEMFKEHTECVNTVDKSDRNYSTLMSMPYQDNKLQTMENDENWFSHNNLLNLDHTDQTTQDISDSQNPVETRTETNPVETTDSFGELIKKTIVESVIV